jgi:hypothetical protein
LKLCEIFFVDLLGVLPKEVFPRGLESNRCPSLNALVDAALQSNLSERRFGWTVAREPYSRIIATISHYYLTTYARTIDDAPAPSFAHDVAYGRTHCDCRRRLPDHTREICPIQRIHIAELRWGFSRRYPVTIAVSF